MRGKVLLTVLFILLWSYSYASNLTIKVASATIPAGGTFTASVDAAELVEARAFDIIITWNSAVIRGSDMAYNGTALPGFSEFYRHYDAQAGFCEIVLLRRGAGGFTGDAPGFLSLTFEAVGEGTSYIYLHKAYRSGHKLLVDAGIRAVTVEVANAYVSVEKAAASPIPAVRLHQNYPNPFNPSTTIRFDVPAPSRVNLRIYGVDGRLVRTLINGSAYAVGSWEVQWDGKRNDGGMAPSGVYLCIFEACGERRSGKLVMLK